MLIGQWQEGIRYRMGWCLCFGPELSGKRMELRYRHPVFLHALPPLLIEFREEFHGNRVQAFRIRTLGIS